MLARLRPGFGVASRRISPFGRLKALSEVEGQWRMSFGDWRIAACLVSMGELLRVACVQATPI